MNFDDSFWIPDEMPDFDKIPVEQTDLEHVDLSVPEGVENGDPIKLYLEELKEIPVLSEDEEERLVKQLEQGDMQAGKKLTESYLPLVAGIAREYMGLGMQFSDLIQEGSMGLMTAVEEYSSEVSCGFISFAAWWIRRSIRKGLEENGEVSHISTYMADTINKLMDVSREFEKANGRQPEPEELAEALDMPLGRVRDILEAASQAETENQKEEKEEALESALENDTSKVVEEAARRAILKEKVEELLSHLPEQDQEVLRLRYGLGDEKPKTAAQTGQMLGISTEEVEKIEKNALAVLSSSK